MHTGTKISLYIDGAFDSEYFNNYSPNIQGGSPVVYDLYFGYEVQWGYFIGDIDDVALWNRALSAQEIQQLYTGSTNYTYSWSPSGETTSSIIVYLTPLPIYSRCNKRNYYLPSDVTISVNQRDIVIIDSSYCDSIQWDGNWLASTGTYLDTLQNVAGCDSIVILNLIINASPTVDLGNDTNLCANATIDLDAGSGFTYLWQDGSIGSSLTASTSGTYDVTITDANGCISDTINVNVLSPLSIIKDSTAVTCYGLSDGTASATVSGGLPPYGYLWVDNGQTYTTPNATNLPAGTYTFVITDSNGCSLTDSVTVTEPLPLTVSVSEPDSISDFNYVGEYNNQYIYYHSGVLSWTDSRQKAIDNGGSLITIKSQLDQDYYETLNRNSWIGLFQNLSSPNYSEPSGGWEWVDGTTLDYNGSSYNGYENWNNSLDNTSDYASMHSIYSYKWDDPLANTLLGFLMTIDKSITSNSLVTCNGGNDGQTYVTASGGTTPYTYLWDNGKQQILLII